MADENNGNNNVDNLKLQMELNKILKDRNKLIGDTTRELKTQLNIAIQLSEVLSRANISDEVENKAKGIKTTLDDATKSSRLFGEQGTLFSSMVSGGMKKVEDSLFGINQEYKTGAKSAGLFASRATGFIKGITNGYGLMGNLLTQSISLTTTLAEGIFSVGKAVLAIPFQIFNAFVNEANRLHGSLELFQAFENVRKEFGDFGADLSKNVIGTFRQMRGELAETGLSVSKTFGLLHERLNAVRELASGMGAAFHQFGREILVHNEYIMAYQKGLGQTGESMKGLAEFTMSSGHGIEQTLRQLTNMSTTLGAQFNISQKVIARDVGKMTQNLKVFGSVGVRQMAQLSTFARRLGVDFEELLGIVDKFDNFEDAADSAARLAQAFGLNVNVMEIIGEQDVGKRVDILRDSFHAAGKQIDKLTRQERNYLATQTGLSDQALNSVFAFENQAKTYKEIEQSGQLAEKQQISQTEAMARLADSIERLARAGQRQGGFFDRFMQGFKRGIRYSREFWGIMRNIRQALWAAERAGLQVGRAFVQMFPGIKEMLAGIKEFFNPKKFRALGGGVVAAFKHFFQDLGNPATAKNALGNLLNAIKKAFGVMVQDQKSPMSMIIDGFKKTFGAVKNIIFSALEIAMDTVRKFFKVITKVIRGESNFVDAMSEMFNEGGSMIGGFFGTLLKEVGERLGPVAKEMGAAFIEMMGAIWERVKKWWNDQGGLFGILKDNIDVKTGAVLAGLIFGPAFLVPALSAATKIAGFFGPGGLVIAAVGALGYYLHTMYDEEIEKMKKSSEQLAEDVRDSFNKTFKEFDDKQLEMSIKFDQEGIDRNKKEISNLQKQLEKKSKEREGSFFTGSIDKDIAKLNEQMERLHNDNLERRSKLMKAQGEQGVRKDKNASVLASLSPDKIINSGMPAVDNKASMGDILDKAEEVNPQNVAKMQANLSKVKDMILKKGGLKDQLTELNAITPLFAISGDISQMPAVKVIKSMVDAQNAITKELSDLKPVNIKTKLENLGKALGLQGTDNLEIKHKDFNINIDLKVVLDPDKLAESLIETKKFAASPSMRR